MRCKCCNNTWVTQDEIDYTRWLSAWSWIWEHLGKQKYCYVCGTGLSEKDPHAFFSRQGAPIGASGQGLFCPPSYEHKCFCKPTKQKDCFDVWNHAGTQANQDRLLEHHRPVGFIRPDEQTPAYKCECDRGYVANDCKCLAWLYFVCYSVERFPYVGKYKIDVTQEDIDLVSNQKLLGYCAIESALKRADRRLGPVVHPLNYSGYRMVYPLPADVIDFARKIDNGKQVKPFSFVVEIQ